MLDKPVRSMPTTNNRLIDDQNKSDKVWQVEPSTSAKNCKNLIREIVDDLKLEPNPCKCVIALSLGDPTIYGNLKPAPETIKAVTTALEEGIYNGYAPSTGYESAKSAVADYLSYNGARFSADDIVLCSGCSSSLEICITALAEPGQNILMPRPGFSIYKTLAESIGVEVKCYNLNPEKNWEADLEHLQSQIDGKTAAVVLNNPSNPCGSNYSEEHLREFLEVVRKNRIPLIADEIYERLVFPDKQFISTASLQSLVPILVCGGLAKRFLVPGWRLGWIAIHDEIRAFQEIRKSLSKLSQRTIGSNTLIQGAIPSILFDTPETFHEDLKQTLCLHAEVAYDYFSHSKGLIPFMPDGAMYMLVEINLRNFPEFQTGKEFCGRMMEEESVFCLPGECFQIPSFMRIVLTVPRNVLEQACGRIMEFCNRHYIN